VGGGGGAHTGPSFTSKADLSQNSHTPAMECSVNNIMYTIFFSINDRAGYNIYCSHILTGTPMPASRHSRKVDCLHTQSITISDCARITCAQKYGC